MVLQHCATNGQTTGLVVSMLKVIHELFLFCPIQHNNIFIMYITNVTWLGLFYGPSVREAGQQKRLKHVTVVTYIINILCSMGENKNIS
jgi:thiamine transporter ThiT